MSRIARLVSGIHGGGISKITLDAIAIFGSSTPEFVFTNNIYTTPTEQRHAARKAFTDLGYDIPILSFASAGATITSTDAAMNGYITSLTAKQPGKRVGCLIQIGSNDIGGTSYASMLQATKDSMNTGLRSIVDKVTAAGYIPIVAPSNCRKGFEAIYLGWRDSFYIPIIAEKTPNYLRNGSCVFDYYDLYNVNKDVPNWYHTDIVHPAKAGTLGYQNYTALKSATVFNMPAVADKESVIIFGSATSGIVAYGGMNYLSTAAPMLTTVYNTKGAIVSGATYTNTVATMTASSRGNPTEYKVGLSHRDVQAGWMYSIAVSHTHTLNMGAAYANRTGTLTVTLNVSAAGRSSTYTSNGQSVTLDGSVGIAIGTLPFTFDGEGSHVLTVSPSTGGYAGISGCQWTID